VLGTRKPVAPDKAKAKEKQRSSRDTPPAAAPATQQLVPGWVAGSAWLLQKMPRSHLKTVTATSSSYEVFIFYGHL